MVVRTTTDPSSFSAPIRGAIHELDPDQPLYDVRPMPAVLERTLRGQWLNTVLIGLFAVLALVLASVGLYGVVSYVTAQRRREFAIRLAVGASASDVLALVLKQGLWLALVGLALGLMLSAVATRALGTHAARCDSVGRLDVPSGIRLDDRRGPGCELHSCLAGVAPRSQDRPRTAMMIGVSPVGAVAGLANRKRGGRNLPCGDWIMSSRVDEGDCEVFTIRTRRSRPSDA